MSNIKAIETRYKGYRFRSRLEARWAIFFDSVGWPWDYEKQGYIIDGEPYLPDFWFPYPYGDGWGTWVEVKPVAMSKREELLLAGLVLQTGHRGYAFCGSPWPGQYKVDVFQHHHNGMPLRIPLHQGGVVTEEDIMHLSECGLAPDDPDFFEIWEPVLRFPDGSRFPTPGDIRDLPCKRHGFLDKAFQLARSARFEHGETPEF